MLQEKASSFWYTTSLELEDRWRHPTADTRTGHRRHHPSGCDVSMNLLFRPSKEGRTIRDKELSSPAFMFMEKAAAEPITREKTASFMVSDMQSSNAYSMIVLDRQQNRKEKVRSLLSRLMSVEFHVRMY
jgi:hypothetical protein